MAAHAKLSASGSHRWINCPGSIALEELFEDRSSPYAAEGTLAHGVAELKLLLDLKQVSKRDFQQEMEKMKESEYWSVEMDRMTDRYVDEIKRKALSYDSKPFMSIEERLCFDEWVPEGFGTADCIMIWGTELVVIDLKYGKGVPVEAENNSQLMLYGLGALGAYGSIYDIQSVSLGVIQPRLDSVSYWTIAKEDLLNFGQKIRPIAREAFHGSDQLKEGDHCRFCKAKARCPSRAKTLFKVVEDLPRDQAPGLLTPEEIGDYLAKCEGVVKWISDLEDEALAQLLKGKAVPGYKVVEGRSNRKIMDGEALAERLLSKGFEESLIYKPKALETLTNLERLVGKKEFKELGEGLVVKPQGKPTLVPESDKRPVYVKDASDMFEKLN